MDYGKLLKILVHALAIGVVILFLMFVAMYCNGCEKQSAPAPLQYESRLKFAGWSHVGAPGKQVGVWIDTETGVCYCGSNDKLTMMVDHDGAPYIANGWRDYGADDNL